MNTVRYQRQAFVHRDEKRQLSPQKWQATGKPKFHASKVCRRKLLLINWLPRMDSNHDKVIQSHLCYRYTTRQCNYDIINVLRNSPRSIPEILEDLFGVFHRVRLQQIHKSASPDTPVTAKWWNEESVCFLARTGSP
jgi:hypothetical protein